MDINQKLLKYVSIICGTLITIGSLLFIYGYFVSDLTAVTAIGIGLVMGATFIFIMGVFLVATEESFVSEKEQRTNLY
ncbi:MULTISPECIES: hypothetical protein [Oceanobacillus]|uniref:MFS transporter n=1 Tax=Oceanobacillus kimchii TaxID=746691 RepID=A0ABQ5TJ70_9BACI|nr:MULTISPECIES: hypothetical protein [Oceanobacillus]MBT2600745.1 hypothetical protein [Oceanobacillus sp. ISL-74]MBT2650858.1 hypothetical protein [Oceanobacillus sp. ISL-73]MCT1575500.1 hypothetical protein [Oceanobacillus kimchii]MCT2138073.1 hypothetical protein [Oceanobacillus kimchii]GLO66921.1 hypothetical protein MACH08_27050 [Oceanobacillus kimchii]